MLLFKFGCLSANFVVFWQLLLHYNIWLKSDLDCFDQTTWFNVYEYDYGYSLPITVLHKIGPISQWITRLKSKQKEAEANTNEINHDIYLANTLI